MNVLITDDHELIRKGLSLLIKRLAPEAQIVEASNLRDMEILIGQRDSWELLLIDLTMPCSELYQGIKLAKLLAPSSPVVVISASEETDVIRDVLALGIRGYIPKSSSADLMVHAINVVLAGGRYFPDSILDMLAENYGNTTTGRLGLTKRQHEVAVLLTHGNSNKEIARELDMSEATVRTHMAAIFKTLKVQSRTQAVIAINKLII